jgi:hypothetical protein
MLLGPLVTELKSKRLLLVGEGVLQYVPFAALPDPSNQKVPGPDQSPQPLIASHEIINLPSASVLGILREETKNRPRATKMVAVFADPVFGPQDPRINSIGVKRLSIIQHRNKQVTLKGRLRNRASMVLPDCVLVERKLSR